MFELKFEDFTESKYKVTGQFKEGLAVVQNYNNLYGYIDKKGKEVIPCQFTKAFDFSEGFAAVSNEENLFGFIDANGELKIPFQYNDASTFNEARSFQDDVAIIKLGDLIGFVTKEGKHIMFSSKNQYQKIKDFSEGLAAVQNILGLWGFINKEGKEVIACQYKDVDPFSEGLCGVIDKDGRYYYINKNGTIKINIPIIYKSVLDTSDKTICITGKTEKELCEKKLKVLSQVKEELLKQITSEVDAISTEVVGDLYQLSKTRKKSNSKNS